jgi:predicted ATPase
VVVGEPTWWATQTVFHYEALEAMAARGPLTLVVEDLHWADDALPTFLEHLLGAVRGVGLLIVITARPELFERHPGWPRDGERSTVIPLAPSTAATRPG